MHTMYNSKNAGFGVDTFIPISTKNIERLYWMNIHNKDLLIGNRSTTPGKENYLE